MRLLVPCIAVWNVEDSMFAKAFLLACASIFWLAVAQAQTTLNPDISVIGDIRAFTHNDESLPAEEGEFNLTDPAMELVAAGYLNPYSRADLVLAWEGGNNAEIEELYATILRGLPLHLNLRLGKYRLEFGRLNPIHPHAYSFINTPLPHVQFFGEEGLNDMAIRASFAVPTGKLATELMIAVSKGDVLQIEGGVAAPAELVAAVTQEEESRLKPGYFARATTSAAVSENAEFSVGVSTVTSEYDRDQSLRAWVTGVDTKYKWKPGRYTSLTIEGEFLSNHRELPDDKSMTSVGAYGYVDYRFRQKYNLGAIYEYSQGTLDQGTSISRAGGFVGFAPIEETSLIRLVFDWTKPSGSDGYWTAMTQFVFSLGPHQPHNF